MIQLTTGRLYYGDIYAKSFYMLERITDEQGNKLRAREDYQKFLDLWKNADPGLSEIAGARERLATVKLRRAGWSLTATPGDRVKVPRKRHRP